jgi:radical SAM protein with 4Fe4S-binding SPASM domain
MPRTAKPPRPHRAPEVIGWETTLRCNMRCAHCGSTAGKGRSDELDTGQAIDLCRQAKALGVQRMVLTGGETLLRRDWPIIVSRLLDDGLTVGLLTNGWVLRGKTLAELCAFGHTKLYVGLSLDGRERDHDRIRGLPGSFARAVAGGLKLQESGVPVSVITTVSQANLRGLPSLRRVVLDELQPYAWQIQITSPFGRAREHPETTVTRMDYCRTYFFVCETRRMAEPTGTRIFAGDCLGYLSDLEPSLRDSPWTGCAAGLQILGIQSNGNVKGCLSIIDDAFVEGNVLEDGLAAIWRRRDAFAFNRRFLPTQLAGLCAGCEVGAECRGGCTASSVSYFGEPHHAPYCIRAFEASIDRGARRRRVDRRRRASKSTD